MDQVLVTVAPPLVAFLAAWVLFEVKHSKAIASLRQDVDRLYMAHTTPGERAAVANFVRQEAPAVKAALPALEGAALESHMVGRATQWAASKGLRLSPQDIATEVKQGLAEGLPAAAKAAGAAVETAGAGAVAAAVDAVVKRVALTPSPSVPEEQRPGATATPPTPAAAAVKPPS